jgi:hypothetical protein
VRGLEQSWAALSIDGKTDGKTATEPWMPPHCLATTPLPATAVAPTPRHFRPRAWPVHIHRELPQIPSCLRERARSFSMASAQRSRPIAPPSIAGWLSLPPPCVWTD